MLKGEARQLIIQEYRSWQSNHAGEDAILFFTYLQKHKAHLLNFKTSGDKWQVVHGFILNVVS